MADDNQNISGDDADDVTKFISDDVQAEAMAENKIDAERVVEDDDLQVTSGDMKIGDLDDDYMVGQGSEESYDEEANPAGDNVSDQ